MTEKKTVLIIDDEEMLQKILRDIFQMEGYETHLAGNGLEGLEVLKNVTPDLILLDLNMPGMDGFEFLEVIKPQPDDPYKVVILSGYDDEDSINRSFELGASHFLKKPFTRLDLLQTISERQQGMVTA